MTALLRIPSSLLREIQADLERPHEHASERIGFLLTRTTKSSRGPLLLASRYVPVPEGDYLRATDVGARISLAAIRRAMGWAAGGDGVFHVHAHGGFGSPRLSPTDREALADLMPALCALGREAMHGAMLLSSDSGGAIAWSFPAPEPAPVRVSVVGAPLNFWKGDIR